jgi:hypothetical protein
MNQPPWARNDSCVLHNNHTLALGGLVLGNGHERVHVLLQHQIRQKRCLSAVYASTSFVIPQHQEFVQEAGVGI